MVMVKRPLSLLRRGVRVHRLWGRRFLNGIGVRIITADWQLSYDDSREAVNYALTCAHVHDIDRLRWEQEMAVDEGKQLTVDMMHMCIALQDN